jgi:hypothetical protein
MKGLRHDYPLSPIFFNVIVDMVAIIMDTAKEDG